MQNALLIYNPNAGKYANDQLSRRAGEILRGMGWQIELARSEDASHVTELSRQAGLKGYDAVILSGGDGSIGRAVNGLVGTDTALGVLPTGTSNVWAQEIGMPLLPYLNQEQTLREICQSLTDSTPKMVDVGMFNDTHFLLWTGLGLDAMVVHESESNRRRWKKRMVELEYGYLTIKNLIPWDGVECEFFVDDEKTAIKGEFLLSIISNVRLYAGGRATLSPMAQLDDGKMDLWLFPGNNWRASLQYVWHVMNSQHHLDKNIRRVPFKTLAVKIKEATHMHTDGDPYEDMHTSVNVVVKNKVLKVLIPPAKTSTPS